MFNEELMKDIETACRFINESDSHVIAIKNGRIIGKKNGNGLNIFYDFINEFKEELSGCIIGYKKLDVASAHLCKYIKASGVYSPVGSKKAIAMLITGGIPCQVDNLIQKTPDSSDVDFDDLNKKLESIRDSNLAFDIIKEKYL